ncbi:hypothetical protein [Deinococcus sp. RM]|uniref:hypothetical protein n=1 Tax=Deinococcus sp. RM TaxID=2316359 RepID=UPI000E689D1C|nr:hypothetical protein D3W47_15050 [Deinococcus sp. RM]
MSDQKSSDHQLEQAGPITPSANQFGMQDPRAQYPAPPFPRQRQEKVQQFGASTPLGRPGQPAGLAPLYVFLASQESSYSSGGTFGATGGQVLF